MTCSLYFWPSGMVQSVKRCNDRILLVSTDSVTDKAHCGGHNNTVRLYDPVDLFGTIVASGQPDLASIDSLQQSPCVCVRVYMCVCVVERSGNLYIILYVPALLVSADR